MSARSHNIAVGLTVLVGLALLGGMILMFAGMPEAFQGGYMVTVHMADTGGTKKGDTVHLQGQPVGKITGVHFAEPDPRKGIDLTLHIDKGTNLPMDTELQISQNSIMGGSWISLTLGASDKYLPTDNTAVIQGSTSGIDFGKIAQSVESLSQGLSLLLGTNSGGGTTTSQGATRATGQNANLKTTINRLDVTLGALNEILDNKDNQENIRLTLGNLKQFTQVGTQTMEEIRKLAIAGQTTVAEATTTIKTINKVAGNANANMDKLTQGLIKDTEDVSHLMASLDRALNEMSKGQGTTGKLITDPHLYNNLVDLTDQMSSLLKETREMLQQWKDKGVPLKLK
jgi:phospholipid/cholesterol/gamma-HCH transport system substrate-binding protein